MKVLVSILVIVGLIPLAFAQNDDKLAKDVHDAVNDIRAKYGLKPLAWNDQIASVAKAHSKDMSTKGYFSHWDPNGVSPADRGVVAGFSLCGDPGIIALDSEIDQLETKFYKQRGEFLKQYQKYNKAHLLYQQDRTSSQLYHMAVQERQQVIELHKDLKAFHDMINAKIDQYNEALENDQIWRGFGENASVRFSDIDLVSSLIDGWLNSPEHKENLLHPSWTSSGVGIVNNGTAYLVTQNFC